MENKIMWIREHGRDYRVPDEVTELVMSGHLLDHSYHNDTCPKFALAKSYDEYNEAAVYLFVEHPEADKRESDTPRFTISYSNHGDGVYETFLEIDSFVKVLEWIGKHKDFTAEQFAGIV